MDVDAKAITMEDAVPLSGSSSCLAAVADATADSSAVEMAAATTAACGLSYCSSAAADGATAMAMAVDVIPSANLNEKPGLALAGSGFLLYIIFDFCKT